jgi:hypothetical protein
VHHGRRDLSISLIQLTYRRAVFSRVEFHHRMKDLNEILCRGRRDLRAMPDRDRANAGLQIDLETRA